MKTISIKSIILSFSLVFLFISSCKETPKEEVVVNQTEALNKWFDDKYEESLQMSPLGLTAQGRKDHYDKIDDLSKEAEDEQLAWYTEATKELEETFDYDSLNDQDKTSYDLWVFQYEALKESHCL